MAEKCSSNDDTHDSPEEKTDDIKKVEKETEVVFRDFLFQRLLSRSGFQDSEMCLANIPSVETLESCLDCDEDEREFDELDELDEETKEKYKQLGKTLAFFGDDINKKYKDVFEHMIVNLNLSYGDSDFVFEKFSSIASELFKGGINWGRIIALLCFGYELACNLIRQGSTSIHTFLKKIVSFVVTFCCKHRIFNWIVSQGGWISGFLDAATPNSSEMWMKRVCALAVIVSVGYGAYHLIDNGKS